MGLGQVRDVMIFNSFQHTDSNRRESQTVSSDESLPGMTAGQPDLSCETSQSALMRLKKKTHE